MHELIHHLRKIDKAEFCREQGIRPYYWEYILTEKYTLTPAMMEQVKAYLREHDQDTSEIDKEYQDYFRGELEKKNKYLRRFKFQNGKFKTRKELGERYDGGKRLAELDKQAWKLFSELVRRRAADEYGRVKCYTCGMIDQWQNMQAGHYIGRTFKAVKFDEQNVKPQCVHCNCHNYGERELFEKNLKKEYGEHILEELHQRKRRKPPKVLEYEDLIQNLKTQLAKLKP